MSHGVVEKVLDIRKSSGKNLSSTILIDEAKLIFQAKISSVMKRVMTWLSITKPRADVDEIAAEAISYLNRLEATVGAPSYKIWDFVNLVAVP